MANNKVVANGETLIDLTEDTVTPSNMVSGIVAHDASGARIVGTFDPSIFVQKSGDIMSGDLETPRVHHDEGTANNAYGYSLDKDGLTIEGNHISSDTYDKVFVEDTRIKLASGLYDADRDTNRTIITPSFINMYEYGDSTSIIREKVEISKDQIKIHNSSGGDTSIGKSELIIGDKDILRTHQSLVGGWGMAISANADLNTDPYCEVGRFYVGSDSTAATHTNCPTRYAYMMDVFAPISSDYENTSYIVREIRTRYGDRYVQYVTGSTSKTYSKWVMQLSNASDNTVFADQITSRNFANNASIRNGSFDGQGQETSINTRIRTGFFGVLPNTQYGIRTNTSLQIYEIHEYTSSRTFIKYTTINNSSTIFKTSSTTGYFRILMRYSDNRILNPDEGAKLQVERGEQLSAYSPNQSYSERIIVPFYSYSDLGTATTDSAFFQAWLKRIAVNYDYFTGKVIEGRVQPNGTGAVFGHMYGGVNANGMPNYSGFSYISVGIFKYFGTNNGVFYLRSVNYTSEV